MPGILTSTDRLPPADAITERSRKFYDGTYSWDSKGFTDEDGVYRAFNCYDASARAPTPLPPTFDDDEEEQRDSGAVSKSNDLLSDRLEREVFGTPVRDSTPSRDPFGFSDTLVFSGTPATRLLDSSNDFAFASPNGTVTVRRGDLFAGYKDRQGLIAKLEGIIIACRHTGTELSLDKCYELCGIQVPGNNLEEVGQTLGLAKQGDERGESKMDRFTHNILEESKLENKTQTLRREESSHTPTPRKTARRRPSSESSLSDVPSNLTDQSSNNKNIATTPEKGIKRQKHSEPEKYDELEEDHTPPRKTATRRIAQKVRKSTRKPTATKPKPAKKPYSPPNLAVLHSGNYRRSARQEAKLGTRR